MQCRMISMVVVVATAIAGDCRLIFADDAVQAQVERLVQQLESNSSQTRFNAARAIGRIGKPAIAAEGALLKRLKDQSGLVQAVAATALLQIEADHKPIMPLLQHRHFKVREMVAQTLIEQRVELDKAVPSLLKLGRDAQPGENPLSIFSFIDSTTIAKVTPVLLKHLTDDDAKIRWQAYSALSKLPKLADGSVDTLISLSKHREADVRLAVAELLLEMKQPARPALASLKRLMQDQDRQVRITAAKAVAILDKDDTTSLDVLAEVAQSGRDEEKSARYAIIYLGELGERAVPKASIIVERLNSHDYHMKSWAYDALISIGPKTVPAIVRAIERHAGDANYKRLRTEGPEVIGRLGKQARAAHARLMQGTRSPNVDEQIANTNALGEIGVGNDTTMARLLELLRSSDADVRSAAASSIGKLARQRDPVSSDALKRVVTDKQENHRTQLSACEALFRVNPDERAVSLTLARLLKVGEPDIKVAACNLLGTMKSAATPAVDALILTLASEEYIPAGFSAFPVSQSGADALGEIGKPAVPVLIKALDDTKSQVRGHAIEALAKIGPDAAAAVPRLTNCLNDRAVRKSHCGCLVGEYEIRHDAVFALGKIGAAVAPALPKLASLLENETIQPTAIETLGGIGQPAKLVIPQLLSVQTKDEWKTEMAITTALHKIDPAHPQLVNRLKQFFKYIVNESPADVIHWSLVRDAVNIVVAMKSRAESIKSVFRDMLRRDGSLHVDYRSEAAFAMAILEPSNPQWRKTLEQLAQKELRYATKERLRQLSTKDANAESPSKD